MSKQVKYILGFLVVAFLAAFAYWCTQVPWAVPWFPKAEQSVILRPTPEPPKPKRYVIWNKRNFVKRASDAQMMQTAHAVFAQSLGARNIKQLGNINAISFEANEAKMQTFAAYSKTQPPDDWVVQEDFEYHILAWACSRCETIPCPDPANPGPGPTPSPTPGPTPAPIEQNKSWGLDRAKTREAQAVRDTSAVKIGVLDTGIDLGHPCNGEVFYQRDYTGKGTVQDGNGHGTHTAGTVAGKCGVGGSRAKLAIGKGLTDQGSGSISGLAQGEVDLCNQGINIMSNSWGGGPVVDPLLAQANAYCVSKGVTMIYAAGNDSGPVNSPAKLSPTNRTMIRAAAASGENNLITGFSSRGVEITDIAPGDRITSNWPRGLRCPSGRTDGFCDLAGTSMATPLVAATCAFGVASGKRPCIASSEQVSGYPLVNALLTAQ